MAGYLDRDRVDEWIDRKTAAEVHNDVGRGYDMCAEDSRECELEGAFDPGPVALGDGSGARPGDAVEHGDGGEGGRGTLLAVCGNWCWVSFGGFPATVRACVLRTPSAPDSWEALEGFVAGLGEWEPRSPSHASETVREVFRRARALAGVPS
ncbi:MAG: hypothetical protein LBL86_07210 [Coriobacteriales bacterium]|jgi:hypothetical protein|nr:hypothetical protein [Coriobacteriales bacterium]